MNSIDLRAADLLLSKLEPLENSIIWKSSALELKAFVYLKNNQVDEALKTFKEIVEMPTKPSSLGLRAKNMIDFLEIINCLEKNYFIYFCFLISISCSFF